jgi:molybdenum cofactor cytidylyltransferase
MRRMRKGEDASGGTPPTLAGIVLAAGAGERMGGPKALLLVEGEPLARLHARRLREARCAKVVIVTRGELVERFALDATVAASAAPDPAGSLAVGLAALGAAPDDVLVITPVDAYPVGVETIARLVETVGAGAEAATPRSGGRGGHPVVIRARALATFRDAPRPLRDVLSALGDTRARVDVDDPSVATDLDTPEDVLAITGEEPRFA